MPCNCRYRERTCSVCENPLSRNKYHKKEYNHVSDSKVTCNNCKKNAAQDERYLQERKYFETKVCLYEEDVMTALDSEDPDALAILLRNRLSYSRDSIGLREINDKLLYMRPAFTRVCDRYGENVPSELSLMLRWINLDRGYCIDSYQCDNVCPGAKQVPSLRWYLDNN